MPEQGAAQFSEQGTLNRAVHVGSLRDFFGGNLNLQAMTIGIGDCGAVHNTIKPGPQRVAHAHGARLASGIQSEAGEGGALEFLAAQANGAQFSVRGGIVFAHDGIGGADEPLTGRSIDDQGSERSWIRSIEGAGGEMKNLTHARFVQLQQTEALPGLADHGAI
jgi:hypothetical protein